MTNIKLGTTHERVYTVHLLDVKSSYMKNDKTVCMNCHKRNDHNPVHAGNIFKIHLPTCLH